MSDRNWTVIPGNMDKWGAPRSPSVMEGKNQIAQVEGDETIWGPDGEPDEEAELKRDNTNANVLSASLDFLNAVEGPEAAPVDGQPGPDRLSWLECLLVDLEESTFHNTQPDPDAVLRAYDECWELARMLRAAQRKARGA